MSLSQVTNKFVTVRKLVLPVTGSLILACAWLAISAHTVPAGSFPGQDFDGTWKAIHDGKAFIVLRLRMDKEHPSGTVQLAGFQLDLEGTGELLSITDEKLGSPFDLRDIKLGGKTLSFHFVDNDGDDDKWQMELTGTDKANLQWIELPKDLKAKPISLTRQPEDAAPKAK